MLSPKSTGVTGQPTHSLQGLESCHFDVTMTKVIKKPATVSLFHSNGLMKRNFKKWISTRCEEDSDLESVFLAAILSLIFY